MNWFRLVSTIANMARSPSTPFSETEAKDVETWRFLLIMGLERAALANEKNDRVMSNSSEQACGHPIHQK